MHERPTMKTKYETMKFKREDRTWRCTGRDGDVLGDVVQNMDTGEWRFLSLGSIFLDGQICRDIADFLEQLNKEGKP